MLRNSTSDNRARTIPHPLKFFCLQVLEPSGKAAVKRHCDSISPTVLTFREYRTFTEALKSFAKRYITPMLPSSEFLSKLNSYTSGVQL